jgi:hypothetical protein
MLTQGLAEGLRTFSEIYGRLESLEEEDEEEADKS